MYKQRVRLEAIALLGGSCVHCGVNDPVVLNIDHVQDDGAQERRKLSPSQFCSRLIQGLLLREKYQLLCCNCNWRKEYYRRTGATTAPTLSARRKNQNDGKTVCKAGHQFNEANTYIRPDGGRMCRTCGNEAQKRYAQLNS